MKKSLATLTGIALALTMTGVPAAFADTVSATTSSTATNTSTSSQGSGSSAVDAATQADANSMAQQLQSAATATGQTADAAPPKTAGHPGGQSPIATLENLLSRILKNAHQQQDRKTFTQELSKLHTAQQAVKSAQSGLASGAHHFVDALRGAEKAGDKEAVVAAAAKGKKVLTTLHAALTNEERVQSDVSAAYKDAKTGHLDRAILHLRDAVTQEQAKAIAMKQATLSLNLLASDLRSHTQTSASGGAGTGSDTGTVSVTSVDGTGSAGTSGTAGTGVTGVTGGTTGSAQ